MRPHADSAASAERLGSRAVSSSERPVSGRGRPPRPSSERTTIFVVFWTTSGAISSSMRRGLEDLPGHPLARDELEVPRARVVDDRVAPHGVERLLLRNEARRTADDDAQLDLPVELLGAAGAEDGLARVEDRVRPLGEDRW